MKNSYTIGYEKTNSVFSINSVLKKLKHNSKTICEYTITTLTARSIEEYKKKHALSCVNYLFLVSYKSYFFKKVETSFTFFKFWLTNLTRFNVSNMRETILCFQLTKIIPFSKFFFFMSKTFKKYNDQNYLIIRKKKNFTDKISEVIFFNQIRIKKTATLLYWHLLQKTILSKQTKKLTTSGVIKAFKIQPSIYLYNVFFYNFLTSCTYNQSSYLYYLENVCFDNFKFASFFFLKHFKFWKVRRKVRRILRKSSNLLNFYLKNCLKNKVELLQINFVPTMSYPFVVFFYNLSILVNNLILKHILRLHKYTRRFRFNRFLFNKKNVVKNYSSYIFKRYGIGKNYKSYKNKITAQLSSVINKPKQSLINYIYNSFSLRFFLLFLLASSTIDMSKIIPSFYNQHALNGFKLNYLGVKKESKLWTNVFPSFYLPVSIRNAALMRQFFKKSQGYSIFLRHYFGGFLESLTDRKVYVKIKSGLNIPRDVDRSITMLAEELRSLKSIMGKNFYIKEMMLVCWYSMWTKDLQFLMDWISRNMPRLEISKHRKFVKVLRMFFWNYTDLFMRNTNIKGIRFDIRGKLGVVGNSKKRHLSFNIGINSFSKKNHRLEYRQGLVNTETGVLGLTMVIAF